MTIDEIMDRVKRLYPSEYSDDEIRGWCMELSALIAAENGLPEYKKAFSLDENGKPVPSYDTAPDISGDRTLCPAPYDSMYIDYVIAKINLYQHNDAGYSRHISAFNSKYSAYRKWIIGFLPPDPGQFINWWKKGETANEN